METALFDFRAVGLATLLGTPLGGAVLMAWNYLRLKKRLAAAGMLAVGLAGAGLAIAIALLASGIYRLLTLALIFGTIGLAKELQGETVERHIQSGGRLDSGWRAAAVGIASLAVVFLAALRIAG